MGLLLHVYSLGSPLSRAYRQCRLPRIYLMRPSRHEVVVKGIQITLEYLGHNSPNGLARKVQRIRSAHFL